MRLQWNLPTKTSNFAFVELASDNSALASY